MANEYKVLSIDELTKMDKATGLVKYYRHQIKTKGGTVLSVDISEEDFTEEKAAPILLKKAQTADKILALGS
ncbi:hypothetical protein LCGC14_2096110 [marine sediment metagenome]|uniref:Uncharacterized protein n=1 Tax=marine sediment metagenome TaxID=412755 RepID=A0A0F9H7Z3_9ZZZZ